MRAASYEGGWECTGMDDNTEWAVVGAKDEGMDEEAAGRASGRGWDW